MAEVPLVPGQRFTVVAKHDTYGLSFALQRDQPAADAVSARGNESASPLWVSSCPVLFRVLIPLSNTLITQIL